MNWWKVFTRTPPSAPKPPEGVVASDPAPVVSTPPVSIAAMPLTPRRGRPPKALAHELTSEQKLAIVRMLAEFRSAAEIIEAMAEQYHVTVNQEHVYHYKTVRRWAPVLARYRDEYLAQMAEVPLFHKRIRLDRLEAMYQDAVQEAAKSSGSRRQQRQELASLLKQALEEAERTTVGTTNIVAIQLNQMSEEELQQRRTELLASLKQGGGTHGTRTSVIEVLAEQQGLQTSGGPSDPDRAA